MWSVFAHAHTLTHKDVYICARAQRCTWTTMCFPSLSRLERMVFKWPLCIKSCSTVIFVWQLYQLNGPKLLYWHQLQCLKMILWWCDISKTCFTLLNCQCLVNAIEIALILLPLEEAQHDVSIIFNYFICFILYLMLCLKCLCIAFS